MLSSQDIDLNDEQLENIRELLAQHIPHVGVWAYGSRVKGTSNKKSDLDLVAFINKTQRLKIGELRDAFDESSLPFRVDLFIWEDIPSEFQEQIKICYQVIQQS